MWSLFRRDAAEKREIAGAFGAERENIARKPVMDHSDPIDRRHRPSLIQGDRDQGNLTEGCIEVGQIGQVKPAMESRYGLPGKISDNRKMKDIDVEMQHVEFIGSFTYAFEHQDMVGDMVLHIGIETQCNVATWHQFSRSA
ncbi:hypothetical protein X743_28365 [Mesorhizobium sp. LNHC252B00]|nr:hypothetical protein X743_28365 [Mesorhizobium sp. LNHC252B00]